MPEHELAPLVEVPSHAAVLAAWEPELATLASDLRQAAAQLRTQRAGAPRGAPVLAKAVQMILRAHIAALAFQAQSACLDTLVRLRMSTLRALPSAEQEKIRGAEPLP